MDLSGTDLRGAVIHLSATRADLRGADLEDVVAFASRFDAADLRGANFTNAMMMQSRFTDAVIGEPISPMLWTFRSSVPSVHHLG